MRLTFPRTAELEEVVAELEKLDGGPGDKVLAAKYLDGSYRVIGRVVKDPDCPQEDFDAFLDQLAKIYDR